MTDACVQVRSYLRSRGSHRCQKQASKRLEYENYLDAAGSRIAEQAGPSSALDLCWGPVPIVRLQ